MRVPRSRSRPRRLRRERRPRVLVREEIAEAGVELLRARFDVDVDAESDLASIIGGYDAIVIRSATKLTADLIEAGDEPEGDRPRRRRASTTSTSRRRRAAGSSSRTRPSRTSSRPPSTRSACSFALARNIPQAHAALRRGPLGALEVGRGRARREDARRARLRPDRPAGRAPRARAADARRRLRPVRLGRALPRGGRRAATRSTGCSRAPTSSRSTCR